MAFDDLLGNQTFLTEQYKYQLLLDHLKHPSAYKLASQNNIKCILNAPAIKTGDVDAFKEFSDWLIEISGVRQWIWNEVYVTSGS